MLNVAFEETINAPIVVPNGKRFLLGYIKRIILPSFSQPNLIFPSMTPKRSAEETFHIHKKAKTTVSALRLSPPPSPTPTGEESSIAKIKKEASKEFKKSPEFQDILKLAEAQGLVEGFYACRSWINYHYTLWDLSCYTFSLILPRFRYLPIRYLEKAEEALVRDAFERAGQQGAVVAFDDEDDEGPPPSPVGEQ